MKKRGKKVFIIVLIILLLIITALGVTAVVLMKNGKIAITKKQKISKGLIEIEKNIEENIEDRIVKNLNLKELSTSNGATRNTTTIKTSTNTIKLKYFEGYDSILDEIKEMINNLQIQAIVEGDLSNNKISSSISISDGDVIKSLIGELNLDENEIGMRIKELNERYIVLDESYQLLGDIFEDTSMLNIDIEKILLSKEEKQYFINNYKDIFVDNISIDMIQEEKATVNYSFTEKGNVLLDSRNCSDIYINLDKNKIIILLGQILHKLESDTKGKQIIISKLNEMGLNYTEADLYSIISNIRMNVSELDENTNIKLSMFCTYLKTLGFGMKISTKDDVIEINNFFEDNYNSIEFQDVKKQMNGTITYTNNTLNIASSMKNNEYEFILGYNQEENIGDGRIQINDVINEKNIGISINTNLKDKNNITAVLETQYETDDDNLIITFNINKKKENINEVITPSYNDENSINIQTATQDEKINFIDTAFEGFYRLIADATENSRLIRSYYNYYDVSSIIELFEAFIADKITSQDVLTFNNQFTDYIGEQTGENVELLYQKVNKSNATEKNSEHQVAWECSYEMSEILNIGKYNVSAEYDNDGYINKIVVTE